MNFRQCAAPSLGVAIVSLAAIVGAATAQTSGTGRVPTISRLVLEFTERETELAARIRARDAEGAGELITADFEQRAGSQPGRPVPRADWIRESLRSPGVAGAPTQMAVHDLGGTAVVSFLQPGARAAASFFVVDVWRREGDAWKLAVRYIAPAAARGAALPGVPPPEPEIPKKY